MFPTGAAPEVVSSHQNRTIRVPGLIQLEIRIGFSFQGVAPVKKGAGAEAGSLNGFQKLLGDDLIRVHVGPVQRSHQSSMCRKCVH
jgi:hypothetical protein